MFKKYKCVLQRNEKDCGPACIITILNQYNVDYSISKLRDIVGTDKLGTNLYGIIKGLTYFNFRAKAIVVEEKN